MAGVALADMDWVEVAEIGLALKVKWGRCSLASIGKRLTGMATCPSEAGAGKQ